MQVASLEVSRELFELSGWASVEKTHGVYIDGIPVPAYDLGYLLRKILPHTTVEFSLQSDGRILVLWCPEPLEETSLFADAPEDAAAMLAIELFKQGVLKP